jgi:hypothetical protein
MSLLLVLALPALSALACMIAAITAQILHLRLKTPFRTGQCRILQFPRPSQL